MLLVEMFLYWIVHLYKYCRVHLRICRGWNLRDSGKLGSYELCLFNYYLDIRNKYHFTKGVGSIFCRKLKVHFTFFVWSIFKKKKY